MSLLWERWAERLSGRRKSSPNSQDGCLVVISRAGRGEGRLFVCVFLCVLFQGMCFGACRGRGTNTLILQQRRTGWPCLICLLLR